MLSLSQVSLLCYQANVILNQHEVFCFLLGILHTCPERRSHLECLSLAFVWKPNSPPSPLSLPCHSANEPAHICFQSIRNFSYSGVCGDSTAVFVGKSASTCVREQAWACARHLICVPANWCVSWTGKNYLKEHKVGVSLPRTTKGPAWTRYLTETWPMEHLYCFSQRPFVLSKSSVPTLNTLTAMQPGMCHQGEACTKTKWRAASSSLLSTDVQEIAVPPLFSAKGFSQ